MTPDSLLLARALASERTQTRGWSHARYETTGQATFRQKVWCYLTGELQRSNAYLLPMRRFIGLGWLRAGVKKWIAPARLRGKESL
jgi:hypothetical protein